MIQSESVRVHSSILGCYRPVPMMTHPCSQQNKLANPGNHQDDEGALVKET